MQSLMPPVNTPDKLFHDGDPTQGIEGTIVTAEFMNNHQAATRDLQQEVINVLKEAGVTPDPEKQNQLVEALTSFISQKVPDASLTQKGVVRL
ncbi:TPA: phage tail protein, partial [Escherichia coli]|nr:phage tail protein [Escherichia coli]